MVLYTIFAYHGVHFFGGTPKSASQIEHELGIGAGNLWRWKRKYGADVEPDAPGPGGRAAEQARIRELERENERLRQERDILKKAAAYFAKECG